jgi:ABC-type transporter Mla maintaining outer membrane lipid asymmetry ATPase subunit MlaF
MSALLEMRGLHLAVGDQWILRGVSLEVQAGQVAGLVG